MSTHTRAAQVSEALTAYLRDEPSPYPITVEPHEIQEPFAASKTCAWPGRTHLIARGARSGPRVGVLTTCDRVLTRPLIHGDPDSDLELCDECVLADFRQPTVYRFYNAAGILLYVGCTVAFDLRLRSHVSSSVFWPEVNRWTCELFATGAEAASAEERAIRTEHPVYNGVNQYRARAAASTR